MTDIRDVPIEYFCAYCGKTIAPTINNPHIGGCPNCGQAMWREKQK